MNILITVVILGIIILVHELGHFIAAISFGIPVSEFAIGMGPAILSLETRLTKYSLRMIPIGGYVNIVGMDLDDDIVENGFNNQKSYKRFIVLIAGVVMNFILAFMIIFVMILTLGEYKIDKSPTIGQVASHSKVYGILQKDDKILQINNTKITKWDDILETMSKIKTDKALIKIKRNEKIMDINARLFRNNNQNRYMLGISPKYSHIKYGFVESIKKSVTGYTELFQLTFKGFYMLITGKVGAEDISGPLGVVKIVGIFSKWGVSSLFFLTALLSVNVGIFNLFPFPALDGGRLIFVILEMVGIKVSKKTEEKVHRIGLGILFGLILIITINDILNLL